MKPMESKHRDTCERKTGLSDEQQEQALEPEIWHDFDGQTTMATITTFKLVNNRR